MADRGLAPADVAAAGLCIGCGACGRQMRFDPHGLLEPAGVRAGEADEGFARICPFSPSAPNENAIAAERWPSAPHRHELIGSYEAAFVGYAAEDGYRAAGSSGGMVSWVAAELLRQGLVDGVAHVAPADPERDGRFFAYRISRTEAEVRAGAKSRYYPVELSQVLAEIRRVPGRYAVVGVPCFVKAVQLLRREEPVLAERIAFTLGLFCGHMKSARFVESFAWQLGVPMSEVRAVDYRHKDPDRPANWYTACLTLADGSARRQDWWHLADGDWGAGFFQSPACDWCDDVVAETADIAFGDAWTEPYSSDGRGTNVVIVRSPRLLALVEAAMREGRIDLAPVDSGFVVATQDAGLRHRREGLAYRLRVAPPALQPVKRVAPGGRALPLRRKLVYRARIGIARWSHRVFALARRLGWPWLYLWWARAVLGLYRAVTYGRGPAARTRDGIRRLRAAIRRSAERSGRGAG